MVSIFCAQQILSAALSLRRSVMFTGIQHDLLLLHSQKCNLVNDFTDWLSRYVQKMEMHPSQFAMVETGKKAADFYFPY